MPLSSEDTRIIYNIFKQVLDEVVYPDLDRRIENIVRMEMQRYVTGAADSELNQHIRQHIKDRVHVYLEVKGAS